MHKELSPTGLVRVRLTMATTGPMPVDLEAADTVLMDDDAADPPVDPADHGDPADAADHGDPADAADPADPADVGAANDGSLSPRSPGSFQASASPAPVATGGTCVVMTPCRRQWYVLDGPDVQWGCRIVHDEHEHPLLSLWACRADDPDGGLLVRRPLSLDVLQPVDLLAGLVRWVPATHLTSVRRARGRPQVAVVWAWADVHFVQWGARSPVVGLGEAYLYEVWLRSGDLVQVESWHEDFVQAFLADDLWLSPRVAFAGAGATPTA